MQLFTKEIIRCFQKEVFVLSTEEAEVSVSCILDILYDSIPDNKRISYGRVYTIKISAKYIYDNYNTDKTLCFVFAEELFRKAKDNRVKGVALGVISFYGQKNFEKVIPCFIEAASDEDWEIREHAQMFFRKIIKAHPDEAQQFLLKQVISKDANIRRFVAEGTRPVIENKWFYKQPDYSLTILRYLFRENKAYPRTAVGNNLSDLARKLPDLVFKLVEELVSYNNKNSYWIAYRACRNLVKQYPLKVMELLGTDKYTYKSKTYKKVDYLSLNDN